MVCSVSVPGATAKHAPTALLEQLQGWLSQQSDKLLQAEGADYLESLQQQVVLQHADAVVFSGGAYCLAPEILEILVTCGCAQQAVQLRADEVLMWLHGCHLQKACDSCGVTTAVPVGVKCSFVSSMTYMSHRC